MINRISTLALVLTAGMLAQSCSTSSVSNLSEAQQESAEAIKSESSQVGEWVDAGDQDEWGAVAANHLERGEIDRFRDLLQKVQLENPDYDPVAEFAGKTGSPLALARGIAEQRLAEWFARPIDILPFAKLPPESPDFVEPPVLVKGEFETSFQFEQRLLEAQALYDSETSKRYTGYKKEVDSYNAAVSDYNRTIELEQAARREQLQDLRWDYINESLQRILGEPKLVDAIYEADSELFLVDLVSESPEFRRTLSINVPIELAPSFKQNLSEVRPIISFNLDDVAGLVVRDIVAEYRGANYGARISDSKTILLEQQRTIKVGNENFRPLSLKPLDVVDLNLFESDESLSEQPDGVL